MRRSISFDKTGNSASVEPLVRLWLLRLLVPLGVGKDCFNERSRGYYEIGEELFHFLAGVLDTGNQWYTKSNNRIVPKKALGCLYKLYKTEEKNLRKAKAPRLLAANVERLSKLAGLSPTDCRILEFAVLLYSDEVLDEACSLLGELSTVKLFKVLSKLLDLPEADIRRSSSKKGSLFRSGLVTLFRDRQKYELKMMLELISSRFADAMGSLDADPVALLQDVIFPGSPPHLTIDDFPHKAKAGRLCLYGPSGTGKTAYGRWLAEQLEVSLLVKRGSDLISMWVGETEKNIAECFQQAETPARDSAMCSWGGVGLFYVEKSTIFNHHDYCFSLTGIGQETFLMTRISGKLVENL